MAEHDLAYQACLAGTTLTGIALGSIISPVGSVAVGAAGLIWGLVVCPKFSPLMKKKLLEGAPMEELEVTSMLEEIRLQRPYMSKQESILAMAYIRSEVAKNPDKYKQTA